MDRRRGTRYNVNALILCGLVFFVIVATIFCMVANGREAAREERRIAAEQQAAAEQEAAEKKAQEEAADCGVSEIDAVAFHRILTFFSRGKGSASAAEKSYLMVISASRRRGCG